MPRQPAKAAPATSPAAPPEPARKRLPFPTSASVKAAKTANSSAPQPAPVTKPAAKTSRCLEIFLDKDAMPMKPLDLEYMMGAPIYKSKTKVVRIRSMHTPPNDLRKPSIY